MDGQCELEVELSGQRAEATEAAFGADGSFLMVGSGAGSVRVYPWPGAADGRTDACAEAVDAAKARGWTRRFPRILVYIRVSKFRIWRKYGANPFSPTLEGGGGV